MPEFRSGKPAFRATQTVAQAIAAGVQTLTFDALDYEDPASWDGTSVYTVERPGLYLCGVQAGRTAVGSSSTIIVRLIAQATAQFSFQSLSTTAGVVAGTVVPIHLEEGDTISANVTFHPTLASATIPAQTHLWAVRVGPKRWT